MGIILLLIGVLLLPVSVSAQLYPSQPPLLGPVTSNAYGPGVSSDATGRPFYWQAPGQMNVPNPVIQPNVNLYGFGASADQFGRPIQPAFPHGPSGASPSSQAQKIQQMMDYLGEK